MGMRLQTSCDKDDEDRPSSSVAAVVGLGSEQTDDEVAVVDNEDELVQS